MFRAGGRGGKECEERVCRKYQLCLLTRDSKIPPGVSLAISDGLRGGVVRAGGGGGAKAPAGRRPSRGGRRGRWTEPASWKSGDGALRQGGERLLARLCPPPAPARSAAFPGPARGYSGKPTGRHSALSKSEKPTRRPAPCARFGNAQGAPIITEAVAPAQLRPSTVSFWVYTSETSP